MNILPEVSKIVEAIPASTNDAALTGDFVNVENAGKLIIVVQSKGGHASASAITIEQATVAAGTDDKVITNAVQIWSNLDTAASDTLVRRTDAVNYTTDAANKNKMVVFVVDPAGLDIAGGFKFVTVKVGISNVGNIITAQYYLVDNRYQQATPPSAIV
jgi:hypothetical protein